MIIAQHGNFTIIVSQSPNKAEVKTEEKKEGEAAEAPKKEA